MYSKTFFFSYETLSSRMSLKPDYKLLNKCLLLYLSPLNHHTSNLLTYSCTCVFLRTAKKCSYYSGNKHEQSLFWLRRFIETQVQNSCESFELQLQQESRKVYIFTFPHWPRPLQVSDHLETPGSFLADLGEKFFCSCRETHCWHVNYLPVWNSVPQHCRIVALLLIIMNKHEDCWF